MKTFTQEPKWLAGFKIGDTAYIVKHWPYWPTEEEKNRLEDEGIAVHDVAWRSEKREVFTSLSRAIAHARKVVKGSFYGFTEVFEARLTNPYADDIPDWRLKRTALSWEQIDGGYECEIER